ADDLLAGGIAAYLIVDDPGPCEVHPHLGGGEVGAGAGQLLEQRADQREDIDVPVVAGHLGTVRGQMVRIDQVQIIEIGGGGLVCEIDGMFERQIPDR